MLSKEQEDRIGHFNEWPPNVEPSSLEDWWHEVGFHSRFERTIRQVPGERKSFPMQHLHLYITNPHSVAPEGFIVEQTIVGAKAQPGRVWTFRTCKHDFQGYSTSRGWHDYTCTKCGERKVWDSSD